MEITCLCSTVSGALADIMMQTFSTGGGGRRNKSSGACFTQVRLLGRDEWKAGLCGVSVRTLRMASHVAWALSARKLDSEGEHSKSKYAQRPRQKLYGLL